MGGSLGGSPKTWIPYMNTKDCSQGFCSLYCPQWCYSLIPPPPALEFPEDSSSSSLNFNPLVIAIIGILVSAFLLVSYYTVISKYCGDEDRRRARREDHDQSEELGDTHSLSIHEPWHVVTPGLDEALIKSITVCKYKRGDGLVEMTDCSVCLSEFEDDESLRLLPKCNHAFHLPCIDTWLKSHSNCPLCRANIVLANASQLPHQPPLSESPALTYQDASPLTESQVEDDQNVVISQNSERGSSQNVELMQGDHATPKTSSVRAFSDLGNIQEERSDSFIIEIRGGDHEGCHQTIGRSFSMDEYSHPNCVLVADILRMNDEQDDEDYHIDHVGGCSESELDDIASSSKQSAGRVGKCSHRKGVLLHCVNPVAMKRSFSSGRFFQTRPSKSRHTVIPV